MILRGTLHGLAILLAYGFAILGPGYVGATLEDAERALRGARSAATLDFRSAAIVNFGVHVLCLVGAWRVAQWTNRWRLAGG